MNAHPPGLEVLRQAHERTLAAGSARIALSTEHTWQVPPMPHRRRGGLLRPAISVGKRVGKRMWKLTTRNFDFRHLEAEGVVDLVGRRYMLDYGSYARLYADGKEWSGRSGRALSTLPPDPDVLPTPLWLLDLAGGLTEAQSDGTEDVRGEPCRRFRAKTDLSRVSQVTPGGVAVPPVWRFEDLLALSVEVWLDASHIRRMRFEGKDSTETLELWEFGTAVEELDWTRLPTFSSPGEAAALAGN